MPGILRFSLLAGLALTGIVGAPTLAADGPGSVQAVWQPQEINFHYFGLTTAYDCDALADKVERVLREVGVHESVKASAGGCAFQRPERSISVRISLLGPVAASDANRQTVTSDDKREALLKRLGVKAIETDAFTANWQTLTLPSDRPALIGAGDCELFEQLRDQVLPKLHVKVVKDGLRCTPYQANIVPQKITVSALVPVKVG